MRTTIFLILFFMIVGNLEAQLGPVAPAKDATPKSQVKDVAPLNLPYQPTDPTTIPNLDIPTTIPVDQPVVDIDWTKIPFIPFKTPELALATDPEI